MVALAEVNGARAGLAGGLRRPGGARGGALPRRRLAPGGYHAWTSSGSWRQLANASGSRRLMQESPSASTRRRRRWSWQEILAPGCGWGRAARRVQTTPPGRTGGGPPPVFFPPIGGMRRAGYRRLRRTIPRRDAHAGAMRCRPREGFFASSGSPAGRDPRGGLRPLYPRGAARRVAPWRASRRGAHVAVRTWATVGETVRGEMAARRISLTAPLVRDRQPERLPEHARSAPSPPTTMPTVAGMWTGHPTSGTSAADAGARTSVSTRHTSASASSAHRAARATPPPAQGRQALHARPRRRPSRWSPHPRRLASELTERPQTCHATPNTWPKMSGASRCPWRAKPSDGPAHPPGRRPASRPPALACRGTG